MDFKDFWQNLSAEAKQSLAERCATSPPYLSQIAYGHRKASPDMARTIERETAGQVTRADLRPDIYEPLPEKGKFPDEPDLKAEVARIVALTSRGEREFHLLRLPSVLRADVEAELVLALASRMYEGTETRETLPAWLTESVLDKAGVRPEKRAANG